MQKTNALIHKLMNFGLNNTSARIYLYLLDKQSRTIVEISSDTGISRTTVYDNSLLLLEKSFIERTVEHSGIKLKAFSYSVLELIIDKEKERIENLESDFLYIKNNVIQESTVNPCTQVRYYNGKSGFKQMMWNSLNAKTGTCGYSEFGRIDIVGKKFRYNYLKETIKRGIKDRVISNPENIRKDCIFGLKGNCVLEEIEEVRLIEKSDLPIEGDIMIYNNTYAVSYWKKGETIGIEIENEEFVRHQLSIFEKMWKLAMPINNINF